MPVRITKKYLRPNKHYDYSFFVRGAGVNSQPYGFFNLVDWIEDFP